MEACLRKVSLVNVVHVNIFILFVTSHHLFIPSHYLSLRQLIVVPFLHRFFLTLAGGTLLVGLFRFSGCQHNGCFLDAGAGCRPLL